MIYNIFGCKLTGDMADCKNRISVTGVKNNTIKDEVEIALCTHRVPSSCPYSIKAELLTETR